MASRHLLPALETRAVLRRIRWIGFHSLELRTWPGALYPPAVCAAKPAIPEWWTGAA